MSSRKLKKPVKAVLILFPVILMIAIGAFFLIPEYQFQKLPYSDASKQVIKESEIINEISSKPYSLLLDCVMQETEALPDNWKLYLAYTDELLENTKTNIDALNEKGYEQNAIFRLLSLNQEDIQYVLDQKLTGQPFLLVDARNDGYSVEDSYCLSVMSRSQANAIQDARLPVTQTVALMDHGYSLEEIKQYYNRFSEEEFLLLTQMKYFGDLQEASKEENFRLKYFARYTWYKTNKNCTWKKAVADVNDKKDLLDENSIDYGAYYHDIQTIKDPENYLVLVDKQHKFKSSFVPGDLTAVSSTYGRGYLRSEVYKQFKKLAKAAKAEGYSIRAMSNYRSYNEQSGLYNGYVNANGQTSADRYSARPGHSEHQSGLCFDVTGGNGSMFNYHNDASYKWMLANCHKYGFIQRYRKGKAALTGYEFESWQFRYVGIGPAATIYEQNWILEEYLFMIYGV
ncbi:MAG: M15 family metallopeptidase [Erysipelotrichaceae bacterium]|nr:M15 family metallopeptidase [Erysipelotrichaceae bacterium]